MRKDILKTDENAAERQHEEANLLLVKVIPLVEVVFLLKIIIKMYENVRNLHLTEKTIAAESTLEMIVITEEHMSGITTVIIVEVKISIDQVAVIGVKAVAAAPIIVLSIKSRRLCQRSPFHPKARFLQI